MFDMQSWASEFVSKATQPLDKMANNVFNQMIIAEGESAFSLEQLKNEFMYQIIDKRAQYIGLEMSEPAKVFLMFMSRNPGSAVMYLYAIRTYMKRVTMQDLARVFPMGYLNESSLEEMWDKQKGYFCDEKIDNCLDGFQFA